MGFLINQEITPLFDFEYIADEVLSASYVSLSDEEVKYFSNSLKQNVINTLLVKLAKGRSRSLDFVYARPMRGGNIIVVRLNAKGYSRYGFNVDLSFHKNKSGKWKIFDVALENDSLINYYQRMILIKVRRYGIYGMLGKI
jgi:phospholipid transport system substrate-binding protein